jgi:hypothetical protein
MVLKYFTYCPHWAQGPGGPLHRPKSHLELSLPSLWDFVISPDIPKRCAKGETVDGPQNKPLGRFFFWRGVELS